MGALLKLSALIDKFNELIGKLDRCGWCWPR